MEMPDQLSLHSKNSREQIIANKFLFKNKNYSEANWNESNVIKELIIMVVLTVPLPGNIHRLSSQYSFQLKFIKSVSYNNSVLYTIYILIVISKQKYQYSLCRNSHSNLYAHFNTCVCLAVVALVYVYWHACACCLVYKAVKSKDLI